MILGPVAQGVGTRADTWFRRHNRAPESNPLLLRLIDAMNQIYGLAPALEALRARRRKIHKILIASGAHQSRLNELVEAARRAGVAVENATGASWTN